VVFQIGFCNIGGFPVLPSPNDKAQEIKTFMALYDIDLFGGSGANLKWAKLPDTTHLQNGFKMSLLAKPLQLIIQQKILLDINMAAPFGLVHQSGQLCRMVLTM